MSESAAIAQWGVNGYEMCSKTVCGQSADAMVQYYCIHQVGSTASVATTAPTQVPVTSAATPAAPAAAGVTQRTPVGIVTILAAIGAALLAARHAKEIIPPFLRFDKRKFFKLPLFHPCRMKQVEER